MPSDDAAGADLEELERTEAMLRGHKQHFDSLIAAHEQEDRGGGFLASLAGALHGFAEVVENGLFGEDELSAPPDARRKTPGIRQTVAALQAGVSTDSTDADRADTLTHLRQVSSGIQERLDLLARRIATSQAAGARTDSDEHVSGAAVNRRDVDAAGAREGKTDPATGARGREQVEAAAVVVAPQFAVDPAPHAIDLSGDLPRVVLADNNAELTEPLIPIIPVTLADIVEANSDVNRDDSPDVKDPTPSFEPNEQAEIGELDGEAYDVDELLRAGATVADLRAKDIPAAVLSASGVSTHDMIGAGYTVAELREANVDVAALRADGVSVAELKDAGFTIEDLRAVASVAEMRDLASASELRDAGSTAGELRDAYPVYELVALFPVHDLRDAGFHVDDLRYVIPFSELRSVYDLTELGASFSAHELRAEGLSASEVLHAGHSLSSLQEAGYSYHELLSAGASQADLRYLYPEEIFYDSTGASSPSYLDEAQ